MGYVENTDYRNTIIIYEKIYTVKVFRFIFSLTINPLTAKLFNFNFHPLEVVSRWRDPQLQVSKKIIQIWQNGGELFSNLAGWYHILSSTYLKSAT